MPDQEPTPLEASRARTGRRYYNMRPQDYTAFGAQLNQQRGYPRVGTERALPPVETRPVATDGSGHVLLSIPVWWIRDGESFPVENSPHVQELTDEEYAAVKPEREES